MGGYNMGKLTDKYVNSSKTLSEDCSSVVNQYIDYYNDVMNEMFHEINNPLTLINSSIQLMECRYPDIKDIKYWNQIKNDIADSIELVKNFKEIHNCIDVTICEGNLLSLIESVVNSMLSFAEESSVKLILNVDEVSKKYFTSYMFDKMRLKQAFTNLVKNAIESSPRGYGLVQILCKSSNTTLIIDIIDNGKPVTNALKEKILNPYFTNKDSGTGLGLPIAKSIISSHVGNLEIISDNEETCFRVTLPIYDFN